jgi:hypothetical protein
MRLLVCGSRGFPNENKTAEMAFARMLRRIWVAQRDLGDPEFHIISGHSVDEDGDPVGPDWWAEKWAIGYQFLGVTKTIISIADIGGWGAWPGKSAGFQRNLRLADDKPTNVLAWWDGKSPGTKHMLTILQAHQPPVLKRIVLPGDTDFSVRWEQP